MTRVKIAELRRIIQTLKQSKAQGHRAIRIVYAEKLADFFVEHGADMIDAVLALRDAEELIGDVLPYACQGWDWKYGEYWTEERKKVQAALAAFDFEEATDEQ